MSIELILGDCLVEMGRVPDGSVDAIICDLPFQVTACDWDILIPFEPLWAHYKRVIKPNGAVVLFGVQPFTSALVMSNPGWFRYELVWDKVNRYTGHLSSASMPMRRHENILIFYAALPTFNKQYRQGQTFPARFTQARHGEHLGLETTGHRRRCGNDGTRHNPCSIIAVKGKVNAEQGLHPTQKPVALCEYLIKTYTNPGETVLDNCMGSASTGVACIRTGRNFIGIEMSPEYFEIARRRIADAQAQPALLPAP